MPPKALVGILALLLSFLVASGPATATDVTAGGKCVSVNPGSNPPVNVYDCAGASFAAVTGKCVGVSPSSWPPVGVYEC